MKLKQTLMLALLGALPAAGLAQRHVPLHGPERLFEEGKELFIKKDYAAALHVLSRYVETARTPSLPMLGEAEYMMACTAYELKDEDCVATLQRYLDTHADSPYKNRVGALMADALFYQGDYAAAVDRFRAVDLDLLGSDERDRMTLHLAVACIRTGDLDEAYALLSVVEACTARYREDVDFHRAYIDYVRGRYDDALPVFQRLEGDAKYAAEAPFYTADIYLKQGRFKEAEQTALRCASRADGPRKAELDRIVGGARYGLGRTAEAMTSLEAYVASTGRPERNALYQLGMCYYDARAFGRAADMLGRVTLAGPDALTQNACLHMGLAFLELEDKTQARMAFGQASAMDFDAGVKEEALYNYALCIHDTSYSPFAESVTVFERFLNEFPRSAYAEQVNDYLVDVYMSTRSYDAALRSIEKISRPGTRILEAKQKILFRLGVQSFANADFDDAAQWFDRSLELGGYNLATRAETYYWRGEARYRLGEYARAASDFTSYLAQSEADGAAYGLAQYGLGYAYFKQHDYRNAGIWFARFLDGRGSTPSGAMLADACNRLGDCRFYDRRFDEARRLYARAAETDASAADYALYQQAFVRGLQKDYAGKVADLDRLLSEHPASQYADDALYERGRAYVQMQDNARAIASFSELVARYPESSVARKGAGEIGLLYYQDDNYPKAIAAYKRVIADYPGSEEARQAQRDLRSIYIDLNRVDEYTQYVATVKGAPLAAGERDSLTYAAAEKVYMRGDNAGAREAFTRYLQQFPQGAFALGAHYYLGLMAYGGKDYATASAHLDKVIEYPDNEYSEEAVAMAAEMAFEGKDYAKALRLYRLLKDKTASAERLRLARLGILRCAYLTGDAEGTVLAAADMLSDGKLTPELAAEARYYRAKTLLAARPAEAVADLTVLAEDTRNVYGAEAKYRLAQYYFDAGQTAEAEKVLLDYIDVSTPHAYWLARSFVLLSDVYAKLGRTLEARQYLLSLKQNYQADDDIAGMIETRLQNLN